MLNEQGKKMIKEKRGNQPEEVTNHYYNMDEGDLDQFDRNWQGVNRETKFLENTHKAMQGIPREQYRQIGYEQPRRDQRDRGQMQHEVRPQEQRRQIEDPRMNSRGGYSNYGSGYRKY